MTVMCINADNPDNLFLNNWYMHRNNWLDGARQRDIVCSVVVRVRYVAPLSVYN